MFPPVPPHSTTIYQPHTYRSGSSTPVQQQPALPPRQSQGPPDHPPVLSPLPQPSQQCHPHHQSYVKSHRRQKSEMKGDRGYDNANSQQSHPAAPILSLPPFSDLSRETGEDVVVRMQKEIATLRCTSAENVSTLIRLEQQLTDADLEVLRSRDAVMSLEVKVQNEMEERKNAEQMKELESKRRQAAEDALRDWLNRTSRRA